MDANKENYYGYNPKLQPFANKLRKEMTKAEDALRAGLRNGYSFRRQRPVLNFIADFMCKELQLVIEVDGITHTWEEIIVKDKIKEGKLREVGFHVLRFDDEDVLKNINGVIEEIDLKIKEIERATSERSLKRRPREKKHHPLPPPAGDNTPENIS